MIMRRKPANQEQTYRRATSAHYSGILYSDQDIAKFEEARRLKKERQREEDLKHPDGELLVATGEWLEKASKEGKGYDPKELDAFLKSKGLK